MGLSKKQLSDVCILYGGNIQCRYLDEALNDKGELVHVCRKMSAEGKVIDEELDDLLNEAQQVGTKPEDHIPLGNNCAGYPALPNISQGYDQ